jgi:aspartyl-tRNA(Asn)/glutamyl-tRNA(Gln) amidotransferase subunit C
MLTAVLVTRAEVEHVAELARLALTETEIPFFQQQLSAILTEVEKMQEVPTDDVPPTSQVIPRTNVLRADVPGETLDRDDVLAIAPAHDGVRFSVPRILGENE